MVIAKIGTAGSFVDCSFNLAGICQRKADAVDFLEKLLLRQSLYRELRMDE